MIKANAQYNKSKPKKKRFKIFRELAYVKPERFIPDEGLNEPELKEGFSLPWISGEGLRLNDRLILDWCHYIEVALLLMLMVSLYVIKSKQEWEIALEGILLVVLMVGLYRSVLFDKLNENLHAISEKMGGQFTPGNSFFSIPPQVRFDFDHQDCYVRSVIDQNFRLVLEVSSYFGREFEFRIDKPQEGESGYIVYGHDKAAVQAILNEQKVNNDLQEIFTKFNYLSYGKDGMMHVGESFDGRLTNPEIVFDTLDRMISLGRLLNLNEER